MYTFLGSRLFFPFSTLSISAQRLLPSTISDEEFSANRLILLQVLCRSHFCLAAFKGLCLVFKNFPLMWYIIWV